MTAFSRCFIDSVVVNVDAAPTRLSVQYRKLATASRHPALRPLDLYIMTISWRLDRRVSSLKIGGYSQPLSPGVPRCWAAEIRCRVWLACLYLPPLSVLCHCVKVSSDQASFIHNRHLYIFTSDIIRSIEPQPRIRCVNNNNYSLLTSSTFDAAAALTPILGFICHMGLGSE